jgi:hypothetical protein
MGGGKPCNRKRDVRESFREAFSSHILCVLVPELLKGRDGCAGYADDEGNGLSACCEGSDPSALADAYEPHSLWVYAFLLLKRFDPCD